MLDRRYDLVPMSVTVTVAAPGILVARIAGEIDGAVADDVQEQIRKGVSQPRCLLVVDLSAVSFVDSRGLAALVQAGRHVRRLDGDMRLVVTNATQRRLLSLTGIDRAFSVQQALEDALTAM
jgi:anti-anti-sigma factor